MMQSIGHKIEGDLGLPHEEEYTAKSEDDLIRALAATLKSEDDKLSILREKFDTAKQQLSQEVSQATLPVEQSIAAQLEKHMDAFCQIADDFRIAQVSKFLPVCTACD